jgi:protein-L-isoaspartate(D-aspartate) O-methyltransferase
VIDSYGMSRQRMISEQLIARGITDEPTLKAMGEVPRHLFVEEAMRARSYGDYPLPIAAGQTISQPYIVALMTQMLRLTGTEKVLEVGTGSGYQAAVLSRMCERVYTIERINQLLASARKVFDTLRYYNIVAKMDDGTLGWPEHAPYDAIIITAGGPEIPQPLIDQLAVSGRMVIPVGGREIQKLQLLTKDEDGITIEELDKVRFVDLVGKHGW